MSTAADSVKFSFPMESLAAFCRKWKIERLEAFGSVLRDDFGPQSDIDLLATFAADAEWSFSDRLQMEREAMAVLGREVDLITRRAVEQSPNWIRRESILSSTRTIFAA